MKSYIFIFLVISLCLFLLTKGNPYCTLCPGVPKEENLLCFVLNRLLLGGEKMEDVNGTTVPFTDETRFRATKLLNRYRSNVTRYLNISDMRMVNWDRELEYLAQIFVRQSSIQDAYFDPQFSTRNSVYDRRFACQKTRALYIDYVLYVKVFELSSNSTKLQRQDLLMDFRRATKAKDAFLIFSTYIKTWSEENVAMMSITDNKPYPFSSLKRLLVWSKLDYIGCAITYRYAEHRSILYNHKKHLGRIDMVCYFGSTTLMPRTWNHRSFERGTPCWLCPTYKKCIKEPKHRYFGLCGDLENRGFSSKVWNYNFWRKKNTVRRPDETNRSKHQLEVAMSMVLISVLLHFYI